MIRELNQLVQTSSVRPTTARSRCSWPAARRWCSAPGLDRCPSAADEFGDPAGQALDPAGQHQRALDESTLGGGFGQRPVRFLNTDLVEAGNLVGRMALALGARMNEQHRLG